MILEKVRVDEMKVLCIGSSLLEITCSINEVIKENQTIRITEKNECGGGHAGNIAYLLGKWGVETYIASILGADDAANKIKKEFENIGVKTEYIETSYDKGTGQSIVILNTTSKNRTTFEISSNAYLKKYAFGMAPDIIVVDGNDFNASVAAFDKYPNIPSYLVVNMVNNEVIELCKYVSFIICNKSTAEALTNLTIDYNNSGTLVNVYNKLKQKFNKADIIVTLGERGSMYAINGQVKVMPVVKTNIVDTNGAGDIYAGAFIYGMGRNFGLEKSIAYATIAASLSTTKITSRMSIPGISEVSNYYDNKFGAQNNPNNNVNNVEQAKPEAQPTQEPSPQTPSESAPAPQNPSPAPNANPNAMNMATTEENNVNQ